MQSKIKRDGKSPGTHESKRRRRGLNYCRRGSSCSVHLGTLHIWLCRRVRGEEGWLQPDPGQGTPFNNLTGPAPAALALPNSWNQSFSNSLERNPIFYMAKQGLSTSGANIPVKLYWGLRASLSRLYTGEERPFDCGFSSRCADHKGSSLWVRNALTHKGRSHSFSVYLGRVGPFLLFSFLILEGWSHVPHPSWIKGWFGRMSVRPTDRLSRARVTLHLNCQQLTLLLSIS